MILFRETVTLNFVKERTGETLSTKAKVGANIYDVVIDNDIDLDGFGKLRAFFVPNVFFFDRTGQRLLRYSNNFRIILYFSKQPLKWVILRTF